MDNIESYILDNYTSPDFPQKYESFIRDNYQDIVPDLILGDETLTDITNKVIKGEEVDDSYLGTFKDYYGESVYEPEVDFTKALALQARYIDDAEYLEWLNDDKMAKVLAEFPTRGDLIDHLGPTIEDIAEKYGNDPNLDLLINNMTYKSHPLAFYEFSQSDDFSEKDGDFGFREWIRKGLNSIKRISTRNKNDNALSEGTDASAEDRSNLTTGDLKEIAKNGTSEQKEIAQEILDKKKQLVKNALASGGTLASGVVSGGLIEKASEIPLKVTNALSPGALTQPSIRALGPTHDPNAWLQGQVRTAWDMSEKNTKTIKDQVIEHLKGLKDSGELKLEDVPGKKYSRSDSSTGEIPMGPAKDNSLVNAGLKDRPNEFSESVDDLLVKKYQEVNKKVNKSEALYNKVTSLLTRGDMDADDSYLSSGWVSNRSDRKAINKYRKEQVRKKEFKDAKSKVDKELGINNNSKLLSTVAKVAAPILVSKLSNPNPSKDTELEKLRLENENLRLRQQQRYGRDYSEGDFSPDDDEALGKEQDRSDDFLRNSFGGGDTTTTPKKESKDTPVVKEEDNEVSTSLQKSGVGKELADSISEGVKSGSIERKSGSTSGKSFEEWDKEQNEKDNEDRVRRNNAAKAEKSKKSSTKKTPVDERDEILKKAETDKMYDDKAAALGKVWKTDENGKRTLVDKEPDSAPAPESQSTKEPEDSEEDQLAAAKKTKANDEEAAKLGKVWKTDENGKRTLVDKPKEEPKPLENKATSRRSVKSELRESGALNGLTHAQKKELINRTQESRKRSNFNNALVAAGLKSPSSGSNSNSSGSSNNSGGLSGLLSSASSSIKGIGDEIANSKIYKDFKRSQIMGRVGNAAKYLLGKAGSGLKALVSPNQNQNKPPVN